MKIGLISPKSNYLNSNPEFKRFWENSIFKKSYRHTWSGIGPALLVVAALTPEDAELEIIDENIEELDFSNKYDLVGITMMTHQASRGSAIANEFRKRGVCTVIGGMHATVMPSEAVEYADAIVVGEVENVWQNVLDDFKNGTLKINL